MADNTQNNADNVINNEADTIFIPNDIEGEKVNYIKYKVGMIRTVPENCCLVRVNRFTGKMTNKGGRGLKFMLPFISKSILVPTIDRSIDYKKIEYLTHDNIMANVDMALNLKIVDPVKYMMEGRHQLNQLSILTQSLLRVYIQHRNFDNISSGVCSLTEFDPRKEYETFEKNYGIKINRVLLKEVKLPKHLEKLYNDKVEEQKKKEAQREKLDAMKEEAEREAEIIKIKADAEAEKIKKIEQAKAEAYFNKMKEFVTYLQKNGIPADSIADLLKTQLVSENKNSQFFMGGNDYTRNTAAAISAANKQNNTSNNTINNLQASKVQQPKTNVERLLNELMLSVSLGILSTEVYQDIQASLQKPELVQKINNLNEESYQRLLNQLMATNNKSNEEDNKNIHRR